MKIKQTLKAILFVALFVLGPATFILQSVPAQAKICDKCDGTDDIPVTPGSTSTGTGTSTGSGSTTTSNSANTEPCTGDTQDSKCCGGVATSVLGCTQPGSDSDVEQTGLWGILLIAINILTAGVAVLAVVGIVYASIMYASAGGNTEQTKKAMGIIANVVIGVIAFALMYGLLNFLVPGGLFN